ncbi:MAG: hypothetical protein GC179_20175 [Anaerolineaceae bacterium]|nr:hypothetical protein [Anaerolineaceae bacterium]
MPKLRLSPILLVMNTALIVYGLTALLSIWTAYDERLSESTMGAVVLSVVLYFVFANRLRQLDVQPLFAKIVGVVGLLFSLFFISQFGHQVYIETPAIIMTAGRITSFLPGFGIFIHQNSAATVIELLLPIVFTLWLMTTNRTRRFFWLFTVAVFLYAFLLTYSRGAYVGVVLAAMIGLAAVGARRLSGRQAVLLVMGMLALIVLLIGGIIVIGSSVPFVASLIGVTTSRLEIYRNSLMLAGDYIFTGMGLGDTFAMVYSRYSLMIFVPQITYTHNLFLAILLGQGIVGLVAFLIAIIAFYVFVIRVMVVVKITELDPLFYGAWVGVTATLIHGLTDARQYVESPFNLPLLFIGMALTVGCGINALRAEAFEDSTLNRRRNWQRLRLITVGCVVLLAAGLVIFRKPVLAAFYTNLGALDETREDSVISSNLREDERESYLKYALSNYEQALAIDPDYPNANRRLGNLELNMGVFEAAVPLLEKSYAAQSGYQASIKGLGLAYMWVGRTQDAACVFKNLADVPGMNSELYTWQNYRNGQDQVLLSAYALETAAILEDFQQTNMDVWVLVGDRFQAAGKPEKAQEWYSHVLQKDPNNPTAADRLNALGLKPIKDFPDATCT